MTTNQQVVPSEWAPLHIAAFRAIWFASLAANVGTWFQNVGGVWLMTRFTASPLLIALMQAATTLPVFLVGFPAGALADIMNRRHLLLATQGLILVCAAALSLLTWASLMNPPLLLGFTFVLGLGAILGNPAWQAINTELVPADELPAAVTLSSVSYNLARAVGPALAGLIIAVAGPAAVFLLNAIAFLICGCCAFSLAHRAPQSGLARRTPDRCHEDRSALRAELTRAAARTDTDLLLYLFHQRVMGIAAGDRQTGPAPWCGWLRTAARLYRLGRSGGCCRATADPARDSRRRSPGDDLHRHAGHGDDRARLPA